MMQGHPGVLSMAACLAYLAVGLLCWRAWHEASRQDLPWGGGRLWLLLALLFAFLIASRLLMFEDFARQILRDVLVTDGAYAGRRQWQALLSVFAALGFIVGIGWIWRMRNRRREGARWLMLGRMAALAMLGLIVMRLISFHAIDGLLYGRLHLNWVEDLGASLLAGYAAWRFRSDIAN